MKTKFALSLVSLAALTACGGGGGSDSTPPTPVAVCSIDGAGSLKDCPASVKIAYDDAVTAKKKADADKVTADKAAADAKIASDAIIASLNGDKTKLNAEIKTLDTDKVTLQGRIDTLTADLTVAGADKVKLQAQIDTLNGDKIALQAQINKLTDLLAVTNADVAAKTQKIADLTAALAAAPTQGDVDNFKLTIADLNTNLTAREAKIVELNAKIAAGDKDAADLKAQIVVLQGANDLSVKLAADLQAKLDAAPTQAQVDALKLQISDLQAQVLASGDAKAILASAAALQAAAAADKAEANAARAAAAVDLAAAAVAKAAADTANSDAAAKLALANATNAAAAATLKDAQAIVDVAVADKNKALADLLAAQDTIKAQLLQIDALKAQLAAAPNQATIDALNAQIAKLTADNAAAVGALNTQITNLDAQIATLKIERDAAIANGNTTAAALNVQITNLGNQITTIQAALTAALAGKPNDTGLPFCVGNPTPITAATVFQGAGTSCVISYADQKALSDAIAAQQSAVKYEGVYSSDVAIVVAEKGTFKVWTLDQNSLAPDAVVGDITNQNGSKYDASSKSLNYTHRTVTQSGNYTQGVTSTIRLQYANWVNPIDSNEVVTSRTTSEAGLAFNAGTLAVPAVTMGGQNFYTGSHDIRLTVAADNTFSGAEGTCKFTGTLTPDTTYAYNKIAITFGADCTQFTGGFTGAVASGVMIKYGDNYLVMAGQDPLSNIPRASYVAFFNPTWSTGTAVPASVPLSLQAKAAIAKAAANR